jgi:hypothetical protein
MWRMRRSRMASTTYQMDLERVRGKKRCVRYDGVIEKRIYRVLWGKFN